MDRTTNPHIYMPNFNTDGNYIDYVPIITNGLFCPCGTRKEKIYEKSGKFATHIKTKSHQKWLTMLNQNKANYYVEMLKNKELVENQQKIIVQLENKLQKKILTIDYLTEQLTTKTNKQSCTINLLDF